VEKEPKMIVGQQTRRRRNQRWEELDRLSIPLEQLIRHYEVYNRSEGKSPRTVSWYTDCLSTFFRFLQNRGNLVTLADTGIGEAREFILYLQQKRKWDNSETIRTRDENLSPYTIQGYVRSLRAFYSWLYREGYTEDNELITLRVPKAPKKLVVILTEEEIQRVLSCLVIKTEVGIRNKALLMTLLDTGLRCFELVNLTIGDADLERGYLKVMGKGGKERIVPIGSSVQKILQRYIYHFRPEPSHLMVDNVFLTIEGKPLTINGVKLLFRRLAKKSGVKRLHVHLCRHTFATNYLINGGDVFSLQQILGHSTLEMVRHYVTLAASQVTVQHRKFSPMDHMEFGKRRSSRNADNSQNNNQNGNGSINNKRIFAAPRLKTTTRTAKRRNEGKAA
jgi:site-specific recombinase XerD